MSKTLRTIILGLVIFGGFLFVVDQYRAWVISEYERESVLTRVVYIECLRSAQNEEAVACPRSRQIPRDKHGCAYPAAWPTYCVGATSAYPPPENGPRAIGRAMRFGGGSIPIERERP